MGAPYTNYKASMALCMAMAAAIFAYPMADLGSKVGDTCKPRTIFCADGDGLSSRYLKCMEGRLVEEFCPNDSTCIGSKDTTIFCAVEALESSNATITAAASSDVIKSLSSIPVPSSSSLPTQSSTTTLVVHVTFDTASSQSSSARILPAPTHGPIKVSPASPNAGAVAGAEASINVHPSRVPPNHAALFRPSPGTGSSNSQWQQHLATTQPARPRPDAHVLTREPTLTAEQQQSWYPQHHHFSMNPQQQQQQQPRSSPRPTAANIQPTPHPSALSYRPHHMLSIPPALSYNKQRLTAVTGALPRSTANIPATRPPYNPGRDHDEVKKLNTQNHEIQPVPTGESDPEQPPEEMADKIDDMSVDQVLSVIGSVLISQRVDSMTGDAASAEVAASPEDVGDMSQDQESSAVELADQNSAESGTDEAAAVAPATSSQREIVRPGQPSHTPAYTPLSTPAVCTPGQFVCEAHGLRQGYFACDSAGIALPAVCGAKEVCYQLERSILCAVPGGIPKRH